MLIDNVVPFFLPGPVSSRLDDSTSIDFRCVFRCSHFIILNHELCISNNIDLYRSIFITVLCVDYKLI